MAGGEFGTPGGLGGGFALGLGDLACGRFQLEREALFFRIHRRQALGELTALAGQCVALGGELLVARGE